MIALCLSAGFRTVPEGLAIHSLHCYFLLAGDGTVPLLLHVERVRDGRSFATRTVQARQKGRAIFTATMSFVRHEPDGNAADAITHALPMPTDVTPPPSPSDDGRYTNSADSPMARVRIAAPRYPSESSPARRTERAWIRARGRISDAGGPRAHAAALAYMSDSSFVATVARVHGLREPWAGSAATRATPRVGADERTTEDGRRIGMMVSIDHAIYFHVPMALSEGSPRADEWMLTEMDSPWAGDERGVVTQRIYARDGTLLATCIQEVKRMLLNSANILRAANV